MEFKNERVLVGLDGAIATVTLNRPEKSNALDALAAEEFRTALWTLDEDPGVRAIVVTGAGKAYCSGIDISGGPVVFHQNADSDVEGDADMVVRNFGFWRMRTPVIGAING